MQIFVRYSLTVPPFAYSRNAILPPLAMIKMLMQNASAPVAAQLLSNRKLSHAPTMQIHKITKGQRRGGPGTASIQIVVAIHASVTR
jgi:hypothetical protein